jgi:hypothetical protein
MNDYAIIFRLIHEVRCPEFGARVITSGRALMALEDGEWWCHGVEPGGMTEHGRGPGVAFAAFKAALGTIWEETASDCDSFEDFAKSAKDFVEMTDEEEAVRWEAARRAARSGADVEYPFTEMRRETGEWPVGVVVEQLDLVKVGEEDVALAQTKIA